MRKALVLLVVVAVVGCHRTRVYERGDDGALFHSQDRQWFLLNGAVPLSSPAGQDCPAGFQSVTVEQSGVDVLISFGLAAVGGFALSAACGDDARAACFASGAALAPWLVSSRTAFYRCRKAPSPPGSGEASVHRGGRPAGV